MKHTILDCRTFRKPTEREILHIDRCLEIKYRDIMETRALVFSVIVASIVFNMLVIIFNSGSTLLCVYKTVLVVQVVSSVLVLLSLFKMLRIVKLLKHRCFTVSATTCREILNLYTHHKNGTMLMNYNGRIIKSPFKLSGEEKERLSNFQDVEMLLVLTKNHRVGIMTLLPNGSEWRDVGESDLKYSSRNLALAFSAYDFTMLGFGELLNLRAFRKPSEEENNISKKIASRQLKSAIQSIIFRMLCLAVFIFVAFISIKTSQREVMIKAIENYVASGILLFFATSSFCIFAYNLFKAYKIYKDVFGEKAMVLYTNELHLGTIPKDNNLNLFATDGLRLVRTKFKCNTGLGSSKDPFELKHNKVLIIARSNLSEGIVVVLDKETVDSLSNGKEDMVYTKISDEAFENLSGTPDFEYGYNS